MVKILLIKTYLYTQKFLINIGLFIAILKPSKRNECLRVLDKLRAVKNSLEFYRVGDSADGGYVLHKFGKEFEFCLSPGVGPVSDIERHYDDLGIPVLMMDASVDGPAVKLRDALFLKKFLGLENSDHYITLEKSVDLLMSHFKLNANSTGFLQMDIEGAEYHCILSTPTSVFNAFDVISIEFHGLDKIFLPEFRNILDATLTKLQFTHEIVHIHGNNCCGDFNIEKINVPRVAEVTLIARQILKKYPTNNDFARSGRGRVYDAKCVESNNEIILSDWWFEKETNL